MSLEMIAGGSSTEALQKGAVIMRKGLGLCPEVIFECSNPDTFSCSVAFFTYISSIKFNKALYRIPSNANKVTFI